MYVRSSARAANAAFKTSLLSAPTHILRDPYRFSQTETNARSKFRTVHRPNAIIYLRKYYSYLSHRGGYVPSSRAVLQYRFAIFES